MNEDVLTMLAIPTHERSTGQCRSAREFMLDLNEAPSNADLLRRCLAGDANAWQVIVRRYSRLVHSVPVRYGLSRPEAEDIGQEVFWALAQQMERIEDPERLGGWLLTTARRMSWRLIQQRRQEQPDAVADVAENETLSARL